MSNQFRLSYAIMGAEFIGSAAADRREAAQGSEPESVSNLAWAAAVVAAPPGAGWRRAEASAAAHAADHAAAHAAAHAADRYWGS
jgi:hypothetical protein